MGLAGREYALQNLRWDQIAARTLDEYREMFKTPSTHLEPAAAAAAR